MNASSEPSPPHSGERALEARSWKGMEGLRAQGDAWRELVPIADVDPLGNDFDWVVAHTEAFGDERDIFGWTLYDETERPVAILPFRKEPRRGLLSLSRAIITQDGTFDSEYLDLILRPGFERESIARLLDLLSDKRSIDCVVLTGVPESSPTLGALRSLLDERKLPRRERGFAACATPLPDHFDDFLKALKSRVRSKIRSSIRRASEAGAVLNWCTDPQSIRADLEVLFELHQKRWENAGKSGSFAEQNRRDFYNSLAPHLLERGQLAFAKLELDGQTIACQFGATVNDTYYQIQEGFDPDHSDFRVGTALRGMMIEELIRRGVSSYDFMAGIGRHKTDWGAVPRPCTTIAFALPRIRARLAYGMREFLDRRNQA